MSEHLGPYGAFRAAVTSLLPEDGICPPQLFEGLGPREVQVVAGAGIAMVANLVASLAAATDSDPEVVWRDLLERHAGTGSALDVTRA